MKVSVVVICLDEEANLPRCLRAVTSLPRAGLDLELIVVDGGSRDRSRDVARAHGARVLESAPGIARQRNAGARAATGEILAYVDADVELLPGWYEAVARAFAGGTRRILGCPPRLPADAHWITRTYSLYWGVPSLERGVAPGDARLVCTMSVAMGREVHAEVGGFREDLKSYDDTVFVRAAEARGVPVEVDLGLAFVHHGEPRSVREFVRRTRWGAGDAWLPGVLRRGDLGFLRHRRHLYGLLWGVEAGALLGALAAGPLGGWQLGVPAALAAMGVTAGLPALYTARKHGAYREIPRLAAMFAAYGAGLAAAMFGPPPGGFRRWR